MPEGIHFNSVSLYGQGQVVQFPNPPGRAIGGCRASRPLRAALAQTAGEIRLFEHLTGPAARGVHNPAAVGLEGPAGLGIRGF